MGHEPGCVPDLADCRKPKQGERGPDIADCRKPKQGERGVDRSASLPQQNITLSSTVMGGVSGRSRNRAVWRFSFKAADRSRLARSGTSSASATGSAGPARVSSRKAASVCMRVPVCGLSPVAAGAPSLAAAGRRGQPAAATDPDFFLFWSAIPTVFAVVAST
jgi:hypothetical protein